MNSITITGRASRDPEVRYYESGSIRATFPLLLARRNDEPDHFLIELWGKHAQVAADYVRKGTQVGVIGSVRREFGDILIRGDRLELLETASDRFPPEGNSFLATAESAGQ